MTEIERHDYDVVVVGAGGPGLRAAIEARAQGKRTRTCGCPKLGAPHATWRYSWSSPPSRSRRRTLWISVVVWRGSGRRGTAWPRVRCGR
jgi:hypothetical protein